MPWNEIERENATKKTIKRIKIKFNIQIIWHQILRDEIENKIQSWKKIKNLITLKWTKTKFD
jgi:hypothetical protein